MPAFLVSAAHKSSGKTTVSVGLCAAFVARGHRVQAFKKGPDYIDPMWLSLASGRACFNLDPYLMTPEQIRASFTCRSATADVGLVEGNKGLYDGLALDGSNSNAALAQMLDLPVVLVLDARGMTRGIAPLILGFQAFDQRIRIVGVILNQLGGARHESKLRAVIEHYTDVAVLGAIGHDARLTVVERHLGLMPSHELDDAALHVRTIGELIAAQVDLPIMLQKTASMNSPNLQVEKPSRPVREDAIGVPTGTGLCKKTSGQRLRIGVAQDKAFGFYYPDDLEALQAAGAELVPVDTLRDRSLPNVDGLIIGGGFPEMFMAELEGNVALRQELAAAIEAGLPVYAECGGLMYLARSLRWKGDIFRMVGALPVDVVMHERPVGRGYVVLERTADALWPAADAAAAVPPSIRGHEFHYSSLENLAPGQRFAYRVKRGHGVDGQHDGLLHHNVLASYVHLRTDAGSDWAWRFVAFVAATKATKHLRIPETCEQ